MKKRKTLRIICLLTLALSLTCCSVEFLETPGVEESNLPNTGRVEPHGKNESDKTVSYRLEGDFSGKLDITFLSSEGFTPPNQIKGVNIPWHTSYDIPENIQAVGGFANGLYGDGQEGETAKLEMYLDSTLIETVIRTGDKNGHMTLPLESYSLEYDDSQITIPEQHIGKEVVYKVDGQYSGKLMLVYKVADGSQENIEISSFPWEYTFTTTENSNKAIIYGLGKEGVPGENLQLGLTIDESESQSLNSTTDKDGNIYLTPSLVFNFNE